MTASPWWLGFHSLVGYMIYRAAVRNAKCGEGRCVGSRITIIKIGNVMFESSTRYCSVATNVENNNKQEFIHDIFELLKVILYSTQTPTKLATLIMQASSQNSLSISHS
jgi:hypothetical protein